MRTTLTLDSDVYAEARSLSEFEEKSLGQVISDPVRKALEPSPAMIFEGFPTFRVSPGGAPLTPEMVRQALEDDSGRSVPNE